MATLNRFQFESLLTELGITKTVMAHICGIWKTDITDFTKGRPVSEKKRELMITTLLELAAWRRSLQFAPSMADPDAVRDAVGEFRIVRMKEFGANAAFDYAPVDNLENATKG